jgi:hypothetical protein
MTRAGKLPFTTHSSVRFIAKAGWGMTAKVIGQPNSKSSVTPLHNREQVTMAGNALQYSIARL